MCDLMTYRMRIGSFNCCIQRYSYGPSANITRFMNLRFLLLVILSLVLCSNDVESNPGPHTSSDEESTFEITDSLSSTSTYQPRSNRNINLYHINAESIRTKLECFEAECIGYDIICVSETWLNDTISNDDIHIPTYHPPIRKDRTGKRGGGVCIYVRDNLIVKSRPDLEIQGLEAVWAEVRNANYKLLVCAMYRPPKSSVEYWNLIEDSITEAKSTNIRNIFILGDLNDNQLTQNSKLSKILTNMHMYQLITQPTYETEDSSTCLDIIATNATDYVKSSGTMRPSLSNHRPVYACLKIVKPKQKTFKRTITKLDHVNWQEVNNELRNKDWSAVYRQPNIDLMLDTWKNIFLSVIKTFVETKQVTIRPAEPPWYTPELRRLNRKKNRLHKQAKRHNTEQKWERFRKMRNTVVAKSRQAKKDHKDKLSSKIKDQKTTSPRLWWKLVKDFYNVTASKKKLTTPLIVNGKVIADDYERACALNDFFSEQSRLNTDGATLPDPVTPPNGNLSMINIKASTVKDILDIINTTKSSGPDEIKPIYLKKTSAVISPILAKIFNYSLRTSTFPDNWKLAYVTPIHKKNEEYLCKNYRPISLLPCLSKVFERCVFKDVYNYLRDTNKISQLQAAYSPGSCTEFQLLELYHLILQAMEEGKTTRFVFCDISKAFDKVWHRGVLHKLQKAGITGRLLLWFESYLNNRRQCVMLNGTVSNIQHINAGVPQGSILGPMLFLIYINDIVEVVQTNIRLYADDSTLFVTTDRQEDATRDLNNDISRVAEWAKKWFITFNATKTECMQFSRRILTNQAPLYMLNTEIVNVDKHKHLGCVLQCNAKWNNHIDEITTKCSRRIDIMRGLRFQLDRRTLETIYTSYIKPIFEYASSVWVNCSQEQLNEIEKLQLAASRIITGAIRGTSRQQIYNETRMITTFEQRERSNLILFYKIYHGQVPTYLSSLLPPRTRQQTDYELRNRDDIRQYRGNTKQFLNSYFPSMVKKWNSLDNGMKFIGSLQDFKRKLKENDRKVPDYYYTGDRYSQTMHSRLRMECSPLRSHLHNMHIIENKNCDCGHHTEDASHFFFECPQYIVARQNLFNLDGRIILNEHTVLFGDETSNNSLNKLLFTKVTNYIKETKRFCKKD